MWDIIQKMLHILSHGHYFPNNVFTLVVFHSMAKKDGKKYGSYFQPFSLHPDIWFEKLGLFQNSTKFSGSVNPFFLG